MAEYIEREALLRAINSSVAEAHNERCAQLIEAILNATTADVVPKSEVDLYKRLNDELEDELASTYDKLENAKVELEAMRTAANSYKMHYENLAREIKRTKAMLLDAIDTFRNLLCIESWLDYEDTRKHYVVSIDDVNRIHDELKKKYKVVQ